jgi:hypothetical protein
VDVNRESRRNRGVSKPAEPKQEPTNSTAAVGIDTPSRGKSAWKHDLHRAFAMVRLDLTPMQAHVWEIVWDHLPSTNQPFPLSHTTIAREGGIDRTKAAKATRELERLGLLVCMRRGRMGSPDANLWRFPQSVPDIPERKRRKPPVRRSA